MAGVQSSAATDVMSTSGSHDAAPGRSIHGGSSQGGALWSSSAGSSAEQKRADEAGDDPSKTNANANGTVKSSSPKPTGDPTGPVVTEREMHVVASIEEWNRGLTTAALEKKFRMLGQSPVSFFSGTNHLFWADLSGDPHLTKFGNSKTTTWICGNCTYLAFASSGSDAEGPLYGLDSFEECLVADYQYDVWRLAVSIALLVRERAGHFISKGQPPESLEQIQAAAVKAMAQGYLEAVNAYRTPGDAADSKGSTGKSGSGSSGAASGASGKLSRLLALTGGSTKGLLVRFLAIVERDLSRRKLIKRWCGDVSNVESGTKVAFVAKDNAVEPSPQYEADAVVSALGAQYADGVNVKALSRRLNVTPATCGVPRFVALTEAPDKELHILDICMQQRPTAYHFMNPAERSAYLLQYKNEAQRFAAGCQALSIADESSTSWINLQGSGIHPAAAGHFSVRDSSPFHEQYPVNVAEDQVKSKLKGFGLNSKESLVELSETWGRILGTQHTHAASILEEQQGQAVEVGRKPGFASEIALLVREQNGGFEDLVSQIAVAYSRQVIHDWQVFLRYVVSREAAVPADS